MRSCQISLDKIDFAMDIAIIRQDGSFTLQWKARFLYLVRHKKKIVTSNSQSVNIISENQIIGGLLVISRCTLP